MKNNTEHKKNKKHNLIYKTLYVMILFILAKLNLNKKDNINYIIQKEIEKEVEKIEPYRKRPTLKDVKKDFKSIVNKYEYLLKEEKNIKEDCPIWTMWYQGIEKAPPIVLSCFQSLIENRGKHPVIIITKYNIDKYIKLPYYIMEKFNNRTFSLIHFSDIVRFTLLFKYGGYWIDSTYFITTPISKVDTPFYTLKLKNCWIKHHPFIKCLFSGNYIAVSKNSFLATYSYNAFLLYWKKYNSLVNYFLIDLIIYVAYDKILGFKNIVTKIPFVPCSIFRLQVKLNSEYKKSDICLYNKLKRKFKFHKRHKGNTTTHYEYLIEHYKFDYNYINKNLFK